MKTKLILLFLVLLIASSTISVYFVRSPGGGFVMEKGDVVYLVLTTQHYGYKYTALGFAWALIKEYLRVPIPLSDDRDISKAVIRVTASSSTARTLHYGTDPAIVPEHFTPYGETIYAECVGLKLCKWDGTGFQNVTAEENQAFGGIERLVATSLDNKTINGWAIRNIGGRGPGFELNPEGKYKIAVTQQPERREDSNVTVELFRQQHTPEALFKSDGKVHWVGRAEYMQYFRK